MVKKYSFLSFVTIILMGVFITLLSAADEVVSVTLKSDETLRSLAIKYFGEPNDWEVILFYNGFQFVNEVNIGTSLKIPVGLYKKINSELNNVQKLISQANNEGAGILAKDLVELAVNAQKEAVELKKKGELDLSYKKAVEAVTSINNAIQQTKEKRIKSISAVLSQKKGKVQSRKKDQTIWYDAIKDQELVEKEHIRTLSASSGEISFVDGSKLNLGENSLAVIEAMKQDLIKNTNTSSVVVLEGDLLAYLSSQTKKNQINVSTPEVETEIRSRSFRTSRDEDKVTKVANYDGEINLKAGGNAITLTKNEGASFAPGQKTIESRKLLASPKIVSPEPKEKLYSNTVTLKWDAVADAKAYRVQIAPGRSFSEISVDKTVTGKNNFSWNSSSIGVFYVRVASIDAKDFTGSFSSPLEFYIDKDITPPYLLVGTPKNEESVFQASILVTGVAEVTAELLVNAEPVALDPKGAFSYQHSLEPGKNTILIQAIDKAGNISKTERIVYFNADDKLINLDGNTIVTINSSEYSLTGSTKPGTEIRIDGQPVNLINYKFNHLVNLHPGSNSVTIEAKSSKGDTQSLTVTIILDNEAPEVELDDIASFTKEKSLEISGTVSEKCRIIINKEEIEVPQQRFTKTIELVEGNNILELVAEDEAGNQAPTEIEIFRDTQKPKINSASCTPALVMGGELVQVKIVARDDGAGLARNGKFIIGLATGSQTFSGMLSLSSGGTYTGNFLVPPGIQGKLVFNELAIQDYLGNRADYP